jgi:DNA polymerase III epsilon subunit-like protein
VSLVDVRGAPLFDSLVLPPRPIVDHNTAFSGITAEMLARGPTMTLQQVR